MRPLYETRKNKEEEQAVAEWVAKMRGVQVSELPKKHPSDFLATAYSPATDRIEHTLLEIKCRTCKRNEASYMILAAMKIVHARQFWDAFGMPTIVVFRFSDGEVATHTIVMDSKHYDVVLGGRKDRGDPLDIEPVVKLYTRNLTPWGRMW